MDGMVVLGWVLIVLCWLGANAAFVGMMMDRTAALEDAAIRRELEAAGLGRTPTGSIIIVEVEQVPEGTYVG